MIRTGNPEFDAQNYYDGLDRRFRKENNRIRCLVCGEPIGRLDRYVLNRSDAFCSKKCLKTWLGPEGIEELVDEYLEDLKVRG